jgi:hypothetical protein
MARVDGVPQQLHVVAVQESHAAAFDFERAESIVERVSGVDDRRAQAVGVVHVAGNEVDLSAREQGHYFQANIAAVKYQINLEGAKNVEGLPGQTDIAVGVANHAKLHHRFQGG